MADKPFKIIQKKLDKHLPSSLIKKIPSKWEKIGDVLLLKIDEDLRGYKKIIGEKYAGVLGCKTVLNDIGGISGEYRTPNVEIVFGSKNTETVHKENNVSFKLDPYMVMFSSGNLDERIRMANVSADNKIIVDLFAGIGYFCLPIAVHSNPEKIYACEINPVSFDYLKENISLNNVNDIVEPLNGDNRNVAPEDVADRVVMGYIGGTIDYLSKGINCLKNNSGIIHFHEKYSMDLVPELALKDIEKVVKSFDLKFDLLGYRMVKSFAPGVGHFVFDLSIGEK